MSDIWARLAEPFPPSAVSWRIGSKKSDNTSALALAYIDARDVMDRLDAVCGPLNWQNKYTHTNVKTVCDLAVRVGGEWIWKADGAGDSDVEAEKGALSDAFKRAAVRFGIGRYLYDLKNSWVDIEPAGKSFRIKASELKKLEAMLANFGGAPEPPKQQYAQNPLVNEAYEKIDKGLNQISQSGNIDDLKAWWTNHQETIAKLPAQHRKELETKKDEIKEKFKDKAA